LSPPSTPRSTRCRALAALALVVAARAVSAAEAPEVPSEVRRVIVRSEAELDAEELEPLLAVHLGEPLDRERVRATLRNLRLAGIASEVELYSRAIEGGLEIEIVLRPDLAVDELEIAGDSGMSYPKLLAVVPQRRGQPLREDRVLRGIYRIEELLRAEGWPGAKARLEVTPLPGGGAVRIVYRVEAGARNRIGAVRFEGLSPLTPEKALAAVAARPGEPLRPAAVKEDVERLERWLAKNGYRRARVAAAEEIARSGAQGPLVDLVWRIERGPRFEFVLVGAEQKQLEKRGLLSFLGDEPFDESLLLQSVAAIREEYQRRGHYRVEIREQIVERDDVVTLRLEVVPGARYSLAEVRFEGNASFDAERLERLLHTSPKRLLQLERGRLVDSEVAEDLTNLRSFYALNGYDQSRVLPARVEEIGPGELAVIFPIEEGRRLTTGTVTVTGSVSVSAERLSADLPLVPGGAFHRLLLDTSVETIRGRLEQLGHRAAIVEPSVRWDESERVADVVFEVLEGQRATIEAVVVRGNKSTETAVIRRFVDLTPGEALSTQRLLDAQRALYRLGIFSKVDVRVPRAGSGSEPSEIVVEIEEGRARAVAYGLGYDTESGARGLFRFSHLNLGGRVASIQLDSLVAQREQLYRARYRQPYLGRWPVEFTTTLYQQLETRPDFDVQREGGQVGFERPYG
jgi:outer membrane protein assembly factor BamA